MPSEDTQFKEGSEIARQAGRKSKRGPSIKKRIKELAKNTVKGAVLKELQELGLIDKAANEEAEREISSMSNADILAHVVWAKAHYGVRWAVEMVGSIIEEGEQEEGRSVPVQIVDGDDYNRL